MFVFWLKIFILRVYLVRCEWVEIPQFASKKSYLGVTPFSSFIYDKTSGFTTTTASTPFETLVTPLFKNSKKSDESLKKSITKLPNAVMKNFLTSTTPLPQPNRKNTTAKQNRPKFNPNQRKDTLNLTTTSTSSSSSSPPTTTTEKNFYQPKVNKVLADEHEYDEGEEVYDEDEEEEVYDERGLPDDDESAELGPDEDPEYYEDDTEYDSAEEYETQKGSKEGFTYASFLPYLQNIQSTLIRNSHKSAHDKVSFLVEIKNRLLYAIQQKIASLWAPKSKSRQTRSARGDHPSSWEKGDGGMGFPSNEGALLTLGFLTFAVFLIKCILKLVQAMKGKGGHHGHPHVVVVMATTTAATMTFRKRAISDEETAKMLHNLDTYKYK